MTLFIDDVLTFSMVLSLNFLNSGCSSLNQFYNVVCTLLSLLDLDFVPRASLPGHLLSLSAFRLVG